MGGLVLQRKALFSFFFPPYTAEERNKRLSTKVSQNFYPRPNLETLPGESVFRELMCGSHCPDRQLVLSIKAVKGARWSERETGLGDSGEASRPHHVSCLKTPRAGKEGPEMSFPRGSDPWQEKLVRPQEPRALSGTI